MGKIYIYHHNDHDGIVSAGVLLDYLRKTVYYNRLEPEIECNMIDYDKELNFDHINFENLDEVYFLDYSFSNKRNLDEFEKLLRRRVMGDEVVWIDHHKSSIGILESYNILGVRHTALCGAAWTYIWCHDRSYINCLKKYDNDEISKEFHRDAIIPVFLKYIDDYDCWKKLYPVTNDFHYGLTISDPNDSIIDDLLRSSKNIDKIIFAGEKIQEYLDFENKEYHIDMYGFEFNLPEEHGGLRCFCLNRKGNSIMFGDKINEYDAVIPFYYVNGKWKYSIFSNKEDVDCSEVAKSFGGGGHKGAAGWVSDTLLFEKYKYIDTHNARKAKPTNINHDKYECPICHTKPRVNFDLEASSNSINKREVTCRCGYIKIYI